VKPYVTPGRKNYRNHSTGGRQWLGDITGDESLRAVLVSGATACIQQVREGGLYHALTVLATLLGRKPPTLMAVAIANKTMRSA
jgi:transposase